MNIFLIGNGFDLYHDLPTKYENFLHTMQYIFNNGDKNLDEFPIGMIFDSISIENEDPFIKESYEKYKKFYNEIYFDKQDYRKIVSLLNNCWIKYFINSFNKDLGWIDFEKEIAFVLKNLRSFLSNEKISEENVAVISNFDYFFELKLSRFIVTFSADQSIKLYDEYVDKSPYNFREYKPNNDKIVDDLFNYLNDLMTLLKFYLKYFVEKILDKAENGNLYANESFSKANCVINFNYTHTFEKIYGIEESKCFHIHGTIDDEIVLGINPDKYDELYELDTTFIKFKKYYQRIVNRTDQSYLVYCNYLRKYKKSIRNIIIVVAGHSLDKTDEDIIKELFDLGNKILITYHNDKAIGRYIINLISIYGKQEFDNLRSNKNLEFVSYEELSNKIY